MRREEFLDTLKKRLSRLPEDELKNVLDYYNEIFLDAGEENEDQTAKNLGSIDDIVRQIYADNDISPDGDAEFIPEKAAINRGGQSQPGADAATATQGGMSFGGKLLLVIILFPIWFPLMAAVFAVLFSVAVIFIAVGLSLGIAGIALFAAGVVALFSAPPIGMITMGVGLILLALAIFAGKPLFRCVWSWFVSLLNRLTGKAHNFFADRGAV